MRERTSSGPAASSYLSRDTIGALSTAVGGAISVVRVSGPGAFAALRALAPDAAQAESRKLTRAVLRGSSRGPIDSALLATFPGPDSFTGEDVVEFHLHGGGFTARLVLEALAAAGVRQALPGEFSFRAVRNGKLSLSQAQATADLITASNEAAVSLALEKISGAQNRLLDELATSLRHLAALGEAGIDFSDQDLEEVGLPRLKAQLGPLLKTLRSLEASHDRGARIQDGIGVALIGLPNAGKSSFFNALLGEDRSIVSETPGTTRDVVRERLTLRGRRTSVTLRLEDTAGLRRTSDSVENFGVERSRKAAARAELILFVVDPNQPVADAVTAWKELNRTNLAFGILAKTDAVDTKALESARQSLEPLGISRWAETSAVTGEGIAQAAQAIAETCETLVERERGEILLTRLDQVQSARAALTHLLRAQEAPEIALFAADVRQALHALGPLIGETLPDDILGKIFSEFCIGK